MRGASHVLTLSSFFKMTERCQAPLHMCAVCCEQDIDKARQRLHLGTDIHFAYLVTPMDAKLRSWDDWKMYNAAFEHLTARQRPLPAPLWHPLFSADCMDAKMHPYWWPFGTECTALCTAQSTPLLRCAACKRVPFVVSAIGLLVVVHDDVP